MLKYKKNPKHFYLILSSLYWVPSVFFHSDDRDLALHSLLIRRKPFWGLRDSLFPLAHQNWRKFPETHPYPQLCYLTKGSKFIFPFLAPNCHSSQMPADSSVSSNRQFFCNSLFSQLAVWYLEYTVLPSARRRDSQPILSYTPSGAISYSHLVFQNSLLQLPAWSV